MRGVVKGGNNGGGSGGLCKIFTGTTAPSSPREYDIWVKDNITINKYVFDENFSTSKIYDNGTLVFYITSNPADQGYKVLTQLFNRSVKFDLKVPLYFGAFYGDGLWKYPLIQVYVNGKWTYLSGALVDTNSKISVINTISMGTSNYSLNLNRYSLDGTQDITDKSARTGLANKLIYAVAISPIDGRRFAVARKGSSSSPLYFITTDKDGNHLNTVEVTFPSSNNNGSHYMILVDGSFAYVVASYGSYSPNIAKINTTNYSMVASVVFGSYSYVGFSNFATQDANYVYMGCYKISKADLSVTEYMTRISTEYASVFRDKSGRIIFAYISNSRTLYVAIHNPNTNTLIKSVNLTIPYSSITVSQSIAIDKDDNIILWSAETGTFQNYLTKYTKDVVNDTWVQFANVATTATMTSSSNMQQLTCDTANAVYGTFNKHFGKSFEKVNANLVSVFSKLTVGAGTGFEIVLAVDPCDIATDYTRQYFK